MIKKENAPKPIVKWAGGKRQLLTVLRDYYPKEYNIFIEPFVGGGAVLFDLQPKKAIISDLNSDLINCYEVVRDNNQNLIKAIAEHVEVMSSLETLDNKATYYYQVRSLEPCKLSDIDKAARFIFLNKTGFNGLYRENSKGEFNVPFGKRQKTDGILDKENLIQVSKYLNDSDITILNQSYEETLKLAEENDFVYLDPPYYPLKVESFIKYTKEDFGHKEQIELALEFNKLTEKKIYAVLSNSNSPFVQYTYANYNMKVVEAARSINSVGSDRDKQPVEVIIDNERQTRTESKQKRKRFRKQGTKTL